VAVADPMEAAIVAVVTTVDADAERWIVNSKL